MARWPIGACLFRLTVVWLVFSAALAAQEIQIYSLFRRVDPFGKIVPQDRGGQPREILSPLVARNAHFSFRVVATVPRGKIYYLFVGSNPERIFKIKVYKEMWRKQGATRVPDRLIAVETPYRSHLPDRYHGMANQRVESFVVDVFVPADLAVGRYKLEPQINCDGRWAFYPMEVRVSDVAAPAVPITGARLPSPSLPSDASLNGPLHNYLCGALERVRTPGDTVRQLIRRNVLEDLGIAREKEKSLGRNTVANSILRGLNMDTAAFCAAKDFKSPLGPEWYLPGRDFLHTGEEEP